MVDIVDQVLEIETGSKIVNLFCMYLCFLCIGILLFGFGILIAIILVIIFIPGLIYAVCYDIVKTAQKLFE